MNIEEINIVSDNCRTNNIKADLDLIKDDDYLMQSSQATLPGKRKLDEVTSYNIKKPRNENHLDEHSKTMLNKIMVMESYKDAEVDISYCSELDFQLAVYNAYLYATLAHNWTSRNYLKSRREFSNYLNEFKKDINFENSLINLKSKSDRNEDCYKIKVDFSKPILFPLCIKDVNKSSPVTSLKELTQKKNINDNKVKEAKSDDGVRKFVNLAILESRYVFVNKVHGTQFYYCFDLKDQEHFYCKVSLNPCTSILEAYNRLKDHERINKLHNVITVNKKTFLLFPKSQCDMLAYIRQRKFLPESEARSLFRQMCEIVLACHHQGIVLRDLKLRKFIFIDENRTQLKLESLIDTVVLQDPENDFIEEKRGCPPYVAPEIMKPSKQYRGKAADMWSLGVILYTILVGRYPFEDPYLFLKITKGSFKIPENVSPKARCLIHSLLQQGPLKRITAEDIFYHPWMTITDDNNSEGLSTTDQCVPTNDFVQ